MRDDRGRAESGLDESLGWETHVEPPTLPTGPPGAQTGGEGLLGRLAGCTGVPGSEIPRGPDDAKLVQANTLIGNPRAGKTNAWVFEQLSGRESPADRINAIAALIWMGYRAWTNYEQDEANQHWDAARRRLESRFEGFEDQANALRAVVKSLPS